MPIFFLCIVPIYTDGPRSECTLLICKTATVVTQSTDWCWCWEKKKSNSVVACVEEGSSLARSRCDWRHFSSGLKKTLQVNTVRSSSFASTAKQETNPACGQSAWQPSPVCIQWWLPLSRMHFSKGPMWNLDLSGFWWHEAVSRRVTNPCRTRNKSVEVETSGIPR